MRSKCLYIAALSLLLAIQLSGLSCALEMQVSPEEVIPGDILFLRISEATLPSPEAEFLQRRVVFYRDTGGGFISLLPVDIATAPGDYGLIISHGKEKREFLVRVHPYTFETRRLTLPEEKVTLSTQDQERVDREYRLLEKLWKRGTEKAWSGTFIAPTDTAVSSPFGVRRIINEKKTSVHRGIDYRGKTGTPVRAINTGTVILAAELFYGGKTLVVDHGMGLMSVYMHLSRYNVPVKAVVEKGDVIGFIGMTGRATGPNLHISVKLLGSSVNPESLYRLDTGRYSPMLSP